MGESHQRLQQVEACLWCGQVETAIRAFAAWDTSQVQNFLAYFETHRLRIPDYHDSQSHGIPIGSGAVESTTEQRCAYLNLASA